MKTNFKFLTLLLLSTLMLASCSKESVIEEELSSEATLKSGSSLTVEMWYIDEGLESDPFDVPSFDTPGFDTPSPLEGVDEQDIVAYIVYSPFHVSDMYGFGYFTRSSNVVTTTISYSEGGEPWLEHCINAGDEICNKYETYIIDDTMVSYALVEITDGIETKYICVKYDPNIPAPY